MSLYVEKSKNYLSKSSELAASQDGRFQEAVSNPVPPIYVGGVRRNGYTSWRDQSITGMESANCVMAN